MLQGPEVFYIVEDINLNALNKKDSPTRVQYNESSLSLSLSLSFSLSVFLSFSLSLSP